MRKGRMMNKFQRAKAMEGPVNIVQHHNNGQLPLSLPPPLCPSHGLTGASLQQKRTLETNSEEIGSVYQGLRQKKSGCLWEDRLACLRCVQIKSPGTQIWLAKINHHCRLRGRRWAQGFPIMGSGRLSDSCLSSRETEGTRIWDTAKVN